VISVDPALRGRDRWLVIFDNARGPADADRLAVALGDLPLAVAQAGGLLAATGLTDDGTDPAWWPRWSVLLPHILAVDPARSRTVTIRPCLGVHVHDRKCDDVFAILKINIDRNVVPLLIMY
jgi:hypothetical protein